MELVVFGIFGMVIAMIQFCKWFKSDNYEYFWLALGTAIASIILICWGWPRC